MAQLLRFVDVGDNHGDEIEPDLAEKFFEWLKDWRPHIRIHGGDCFNFAALRKKASEDEKRQAMAPDIELGKDFLKRFFDGGEHKVFLRGNHDERIFDLRDSATDASLQHCAEKVCMEIEELTRKLRVRMLPYDSALGVLDLLGTRSLHGYAAGVGSARKFAQVYGTCGFHHTHAMDVCPVEKWPEVSVAHGSGCLCQIRQAYNSRQIGTLRHENGWLYGITDGKRATYWQAKFKDGRIYAAAEVKAY